MAIIYKYAIDGDTWSTDANGTTTLTRELVFELTGADYGKLERLYKSDKAPQIPVKGAAHPNNSLFRATGENSVRKEADGKNAVVTVKYSHDSGDGLGDSGGMEKKPWDLGFASFTTSSEIIAKPMERDIYGNWIKTTAGTGIETVHDERHIIIRATYALKDFSPTLITQFMGTVNEKQIELINGTTLKANVWRIRDLSYSNAKTYDDQGKLKWSYYNVSIELEGIAGQAFGETEDDTTQNEFVVYGIGGSKKTLKRGKISGFATIVANRSTRMVPAGHKYTVRIYQCKQSDGSVFFGSRSDCNKRAYSRDDVEEVTEPVWLNENGQPAELNAQGEPSKKIWLVYHDFRVKDWKPLSFPKK